MSTDKYRSGRMAKQVVAFSVSFQRDNLLARGLGVEHLRELLLRVARPLLRESADLAYGGNWRQTDDNFLFDLLRLVSSEQSDNSGGGPDTSFRIGKIYNHSAWPNYLQVTPGIEAQWIDACRIVRITQQEAGLSDDEIIPDADVNARRNDPRLIFNSAVTLSAMRRIMMDGKEIEAPDVPGRESVPAVTVRILLGGSVDKYSGFVPGIFEEALVTLKAGKPMFLLGGFGGATEILAQAMLTSGDAVLEPLTLKWHRERNERLGELLDSEQEYGDARRFPSTSGLLAELVEYVKKARAALADTLHTGLTDEETRQLMTTPDITTAVRLLRGWLEKRKSSG